MDVSTANKLVRMWSVLESLFSKIHRAKVPINLLTNLTDVVNPERIHLVMSTFLQDQIPQAISVK